jgi:hypothetical protein
VGLADTIRIMRGHLTPEETAERDAAARRRREAADQQVQQQAATAKREEQTAAAAAARQRKHGERIQRAAAISSVELVCHEDTLNSIRSEIRREIGRLSGADKIKELGEGRRAIRLSGPELAVVLQETGRTARITDDPYFHTPAERAVALQVYRAVSRIVDQADPDADPSRALPPIVIDAGAARRDDQDQDQPAGTPPPRA